MTRALLILGLFAIGVAAWRMGASDSVYGAPLLVAILLGLREFDRR